MDQGANVLGPIPSVNRANASVRAGRVDAAILDVTLNPLVSFRLADALEQEYVPFVFVTMPLAPNTDKRFRGYELGTPDLLKHIARALFDQEDHERRRLAACVLPPRGRGEIAFGVAHAAAVHPQNIFSELGLCR